MKIFLFNLFFVCVFDRLLVNLVVISSRCYRYKFESVGTKVELEFDFGCDDCIDLSTFVVIMRYKFHFFW